MRARAILSLLVVALAVTAGTAHATGATSVYQVWLERGGKLWLAKREQPATTTPARAAMQALLAAPTVAESAAGVRSEVPAGTDVLGLGIANGTATVDLGGGFASAGTRAAVWMRLAQVTYTLTQFASVDRVALRVDGRAVSTLAGVSVPRTMTRSTFHTLMPLITVWNPPIGSSLAGSVRVSGDADVFAGHVHVAIAGQSGAIIARAQTTTSCGTGCRGGYTVLVPFTVANNQLGGVVVYDDDTDGNGVPQHRVRVPVVLLA